MKRYRLIIIGLLAASLSMMAQEETVDVNSGRPNLLEYMSGVEVIQDSTVAMLLEEAMYGKREWVEVDGYRVQVYSSNQQQYAKAEALELEARLKEKVEHTIYVQYLPPFWKVRIGDFRTADEAKEYKKIFVEHFPNMTGVTYIVRDKIKVLQ
jgi:hypothetical protein